VTAVTPEALAAAREALPCTCDGLQPHDLSCDMAISDDGLNAALEAAAPHIRAQVYAAERERIAARMEVLAANYPEDLFRPEGTSRDSIGGTAMRHAYRNAARDIREGDHDG
jgi:hypothetical protein